MSTEPESPPPPGAAAILAPAAPAFALAQSGDDDDTDYSYYDTPSGNIWRPGAEPGPPPATGPRGRAASPGGRAAGPLPGREAPACDRPDRGASPVP